MSQGEGEACVTGSTVPDALEWGFGFAFEPPSAGWLQLEVVATHVEM